MLWGAGMPIFDSIAHAMTTLATGGYSTKSSSLAAFNSSTIEINYNFWNDCRLFTFCSLSYL